MDCHFLALLCLSVTGYQGPEPLSTSGSFQDTTLPNHLLKSKNQPIHKPLKTLDWEINKRMGNT